MASAVMLPNGSVSIILNTLEAQVIFELSGNITGGDTTYRKITDTIYSVLEEAGVANELEGSFHFFEENDGIRARKMLKEHV